MTTLVTTETKLSDIIIHEPATLAVLNRFGIALGVGDKTVADVCRERCLDPTFFVTILNTYIHHDYFPERVLSSFSAATIIGYLTKTNVYYERFQIPNIERHFQLLISKSDPQNTNLALMQRFFGEVKQELLRRIADDRDRWFPEVIALERKAKVAGDATIKDFDEGPDTIEDKLNDLINMFVIHLSGDYDLNLGHAVLFSLFSLRNDIAQNNRIRNRILRPLAATLTLHQHS